MKRFLIILVIGIFSIAMIGCEDTMNTTTNKINTTTSNNESKIVQLISDNSFSQGFKLLGVSTAEDGRTIEAYLDYNGEAIDNNDSPWYMAQWWTPYNVADANFFVEDNLYVYQTQSRTIKVNPQEKYLYFELLGEEEYLGSTRQTASQNWPHLLIEQVFSKSVKISDLKSINIHLEVSVEQCIDKNGDVYDPSIHAAQLLWYFTLNNVVDPSLSSDEVGTNGDFLWFGVPIFDNRSDFIKSSATIDSGFVGNTNKLIYSMGSSMYIDEKIQFGKTYTIDIDILPYLKEAFIYAVNNDALVNCKFENMELSYMNYGWELPGAFNVISTFKNMSVEAIYK